MEWPAHLPIVGGGGVTLCIKWCFGMYRVGNGRETRVH